MTIGRVLYVRETLEYRINLHSFLRLEVDLVTVFNFGRANGTTWLCLSIKPPYASQAERASGDRTVDQETHGKALNLGILWMVMTGSLSAPHCLSLFTYRLEMTPTT